MSLINFMTRGLTPAADDDFWYSPAGALASNGKRLTPEWALTIATVYACVKVLSEDIAGLPLITYSRLPNDGRERATNLRMYSLLHDEPNEAQTSFEWREMKMAHVLLRGNAFSRVHTNGAGQADALIPMHPDHVRLELSDRGELLYKWRRNGVEDEVTLLQEEVLHIRGLSNNGHVGMSVVGLARESFALTQTLEQQASRSFSQGTRLSGVLKYPGKLSDDAKKRLKASWDSTYAGPDNAGKTALLEEGMEWSQLGMSHHDAEFLAQRGHQAIQATQWFRVQPHKVGLLDRATFNNVEHLSIEHVRDACRPWMVRWEQAIHRTLMPGDTEHYSEFLVDALLRGDVAARYSAYAIGIQWGIMSPNDVRKLENLNPRDGGDGYFEPLNMRLSGEGLSLKERSEAAAALVRVGYEPDDAARVVGLPDMDHLGLPPVTVQKREGNARSGSSGSGGNNGQAMLLAEELAGRLVRKEIQAITKAARNHAGDSKAFLAAAAEFYEGHGDELVRSMHLSGRAAVLYRDRQLAALEEGGMAAVEDWAISRPGELARLALGEE